MQDKPQSIVDHLTELRSRIIKTVLAIVACVTVAMVFAHRVFTFILQTATEGDIPVILVQNKFSDAFLTEFRLAIIGGLILAFPFVLYQIAAFVMPALHAHERRLLYMGLPFATLLFGVGWSFGWFVVVPLTKSFFLGMASTAGIQNQITPGAYIDFVLGICNPLGIAFELPLVGLILAFPFVLYQIAAFVMPALHAHERRLLYIGLPFATLLFAVGWAFGWFVVVPLTKSFFLGMASTAGIQNQITPGAYIDFVLGICNPLGIAFELPLVVLILARIGLVSASFLARIRKFAFLGIMVIAAVLSPPDVISMTIFMVPLYGLYEISIVLARFAGKKRDA